MSLTKQQVLSELHRLVKKDDHKAIIQYCNKAIANGIKDDDIIEAKIVAALHAHQVCILCIEIRIYHIDN